MFPANVTPHEAEKYLTSGALLVDVREQDEWDEMHVAQATFMPLASVGDRVAEIPRDRDVILMCRSGRRSGIAQQQLIALGYERVANLSGGILAWHDAGLPVIMPQ